MPPSQKFYERACDRLLNRDTIAIVQNWTVIHAPAPLISLAASNDVSPRGPNSVFARVNSTVVEVFPTWRKINCQWRVEPSSVSRTSPGESTLCNPV
jgi:hypothetical protein